MKKITKFAIYSVGVIAFTKSMKYFLDKNMEVKDIAAELNLTVDTVKLWNFKYENGV